MEMEKEEAEAGELKSTSSLFPLLFQSASGHTNPENTVPKWLSNSSFTTDLSVVNDAISSQQGREVLLQPELDKEVEGEEGERGNNSKQPRPQLNSYELVESSSASDVGYSHENEGRGKKENRKSKRKNRKRRRSSGDVDAAFDFGPSSRKSGVRSWANSSKLEATSKDYYFDSRGDRDNLAFGSLYRMDVARYKLYSFSKSLDLNSQSMYRLNPRSLVSDGDVDIDALDNKLKSGGRYWSAKYTALERHKNLKRIRIVAHEKSPTIIPGNFIPFLDDQTSSEGVDSGSLSKAAMVEESWEDEVLRRTKEFNKMSRERPHDEKVWLAFAEFQDKVASMQPQKGARLQTLEKKISILEKATDLNPDSEELLLSLMNAYQSRDSTDVFMGRWEKILMQHSGSCKLWKTFLSIIQGEFSRFKVSEMRKLYTNAIQALSAGITKQYRQLHQNADAASLDPAIIETELGLVDVFLSLCRFEWQAGYRELATALFQAEIEYALFCPPLNLTDQSKRRLFEHFWNSNGARVGEDGALGWSTWLEKEEEQRQKVIHEESHKDDAGGWTGWTQPLSKSKDISGSPEGKAVDNEAIEELNDELETEDMEQNDDTETLLKLLGLNVDNAAEGDVKDTETWTRWLQEELSRDSDQWMPVRAKSDGISHSNETADREGDEQLLRVILFEDVCDYMFTISSQEARLSLISQFIDFFGGKVSQRESTNSSSWAEKTLSLEELPDSLLEDVRRIHSVLNKTNDSPSGFSLELLLGTSNNIFTRTSMMKFLRNATLLCLTVFPRNHILDEAALVAEELSNTRMNSSSCSVTPCRALAKILLKSNRQDVLLCGVYAKREAVFGNIDHARKIFDMALASVEGLPPDLRSNASLLYFWYAEMELENSYGNSSESSSRAIHILACFGSGVNYSPFKCQPTNLQQLRAHQGFKERLRVLKSTWARGIMDDNSIALICSAALFEELTAGFAAGIEVLNQAFSMVLPERRSQSSQLEYLFNYCVKVHRRHHAQPQLVEIWGSILQGLQIYPNSPELYTALVEISHLHTVPNKLRLIFDNYCHKKPSVIVSLFALLFEMSRGGSPHRIHGLFERALTNDRLRNSVLLWRCYIAYEIDIAHNSSAARRIFFRAVHACPWSKQLWLDGFSKLSSILSAKELSDLHDVMRDKELNLRTDIYEILLQDEVVT